MAQDKSAAASPFAALSYQEQQDRWLEWRSRQLDYRPANSPEPDPPFSGAPDRPLPPIQLPNLIQTAPTHHQELDRVLARHAAAARNLGAFQSTSIRESAR